MIIQYFVRLGDLHTSVCLEPILTTLLALKLGQSPRQPDAHQAIQAWLQQQLNDSQDPTRCYVSQWLQEQVLLAIAEQPLSERYQQWVVDEAPPRRHLTG